VNEVWVVNASPVIVLAKVGHLQLLKQLPGELLLPVPVAMEIQSGPRLRRGPASPGRWLGRPSHCRPHSLRTRGVGAGAGRNRGPGRGPGTSPLHGRAR